MAAWAGPGTPAATRPLLADADADRLSRWLEADACATAALAELADGHDAALTAERQHGL